MKAAHRNASPLQRADGSTRWRPGCSRWLWVLPLIYAVWTAFHPPEYAARFDVWNAPLTLDNFARAWEAAPFARYFLNTTCWW
jgi:sn-glycerol 3-phosphate transport system permease protein